MDRDERLECANTILRQMGGKVFSMMTGARDFVAVKDGGLSFALPSHFAKSGIERVTVRLNPSDLYDMEFRDGSPGAGKVVSRHEDVYCDSLRDVFERETGLALSLPRIIARDRGPSL